MIKSGRYDARILLRMAEGSAVKPGDKGTLLLDNMRMQRRARLTLPSPTPHYILP
jgi:hypothetical protein